MSFVTICWWWYTTHVNILKSTLNNNTNIVYVLFATTLNLPTLHHIMVKRKWNVNTSFTLQILGLIICKGDQTLECLGFTFTSKQRHIIMEMIIMFYNKGVYVANERGHCLWNNATMKIIIKLIACNKIMCKESKPFILKAMYVWLLP